jgi:hypothetical protein
MSQQIDFCGENKIKKIKRESRKGEKEIGGHVVYKHAHKR